MSATAVRHAAGIKIAARAIGLERVGTLFGIAAFTVGAMYWALLFRGDFGSDGRIYHDAAGALLSGADPWSVTVNGWAYFAPPLELVPFVALTWVPSAVFNVLWLAVCAVSAVVIVRSLRLPLWWLLFPPLVQGVMLGNPAIPGLAAVVAGVPLVGVILRPQLILSTTPRTAAAFVGLSVLAVALVPGFLSSLNGGLYQAQSGVPVNWWGSPLALLALVACALLARTDRKAAAWLVVPAVAPAMGWYGLTMVMPVGSVWLAIACALPVQGLGALAITGYALTISGLRFRERSRDAAVAIDARSASLRSSATEGDTERAAGKPGDVRGEGARRPV